MPEDEMRRRQREQFQAASGQIIGCMMALIVCGGLATALAIWMIKWAIG